MRLDVGCLSVCLSVCTVSEKRIEATVVKFGVCNDPGALCCGCVFVSEKIRGENHPIRKLSGAGYTV